MSTTWESTDAEQIDYRKRSRKRKVERFASNPSIDAKIKEHVCPGLLPSTQRLLLELATDEDRELIADFFIDYAYHETRGIAVNTKRAYIANLVYLSRYCKNKKSFKDMTNEDVVLGYLPSLKRTHTLQVQLQQLQL